MAHPPDNVDWLILSLLGEGPRTFQQLTWHLNLLDKIDLMMGLRRLLNTEQIVRDGDQYAIPAKAQARHNRTTRSRGNPSSYTQVVGLKGFIVVDSRGKFCGFGENEEELFAAVRAYSREHNAFQRPYHIWNTEDLAAVTPQRSLRNPASRKR